MKTPMLPEIIDIPAPTRIGVMGMDNLDVNNLPYDDGEPLETAWHRYAMNQLCEVAIYYYRARNDFYVGGNMFLYYNLERQRHRDFRGPDFFFVWGVEPHRWRKYYAVWEEDYHYPNVILELLSESTIQIDRVEKRALYQNILHTPEYFLCDFEVASLEGLRLNAQKVYEPIPANERGWIWSEQLQLWLGPWTGAYLERKAIWPRFYDPSGRLVPRFDEAAQQHAEEEKQRADQKELLSEHEKQRADAARQNAEQEKQRADAAETEMARLRRELEEMRQRFPKAPE